MNITNHDIPLIFFGMQSRRLIIGFFPLISIPSKCTTVQAERALKEGKFTRKQRVSVVDTVSAVILLQTYLSYDSCKIE